MSTTDQVREVVSEAVKQTAILASIATARDILEGMVKVGAISDYAIVEDEYLQVAVKKVEEQNFVTVPLSTPIYPS